MGKGWKTLIIAGFVVGLIGLITAIGTSVWCMELESMMYGW